VRYFSFDPCEVTLHGRSVEGYPSNDTADPNLNELLHAAQAHGSPDDLATILYSSGTTGEPKGVMLTHGNLVSNARGMSEAFDVTPDDLRLCMLPLSHIFARTCDLYTWLGRGSQLAFVESRERILANCAELHPTLMNGVPYFYEKVCRSLRASGQAEQPGQLLELFGGRMRSCCSGGAALPVHVAEWFEQRGMPLLQGYGLTESSPVISMSVRAAYKNGYVGRALPGIEIQIANDGEVLTRGPHVMRGYWKRPDATAEVIRDGWLHTGDLGELDSDGFLKITGRKKELLVTAAGKNIAPVALEALLTEDPLILQAVVLGDGRNYLAALLVPNPDVLREYIIKHAIPVASRGEALQHPSVLELYRRVIDERLRGVSHQEQIGRFVLLDRGFTVESGELTPTLKLRRGVIQANFAELIESLYRT
jgi:long-chain acyl-CoA synthetase